MKLADDLATERAIINAWERGDISTREMASALRRFDELDAAERQAYKNLARQTGDDAVEVLAKSDGPARRVAADGGVDRAYREAIADAADSEAIDSFDQIDRAVRDVDGLTEVQRRQAQQLLVEADGSGVEFVDELDERRSLISISIAPSRGPSYGCSPATTRALPNGSQRST